MKQEMSKNEKNESWKNENDILYHYTSANSLLKILEDLTLKCSSIDKLNDLYEFNLGGVDLNDFYNLNRIKPMIRLISFTTDYKWNKIYIKGTNHPRMWAQYADNNKGACIAINKTKFIEENLGLLGDNFYAIENIKYAYKDFMLTDNLKTGSIVSFNPEQYVRKHYRKLFFKKHIDWRDEHEVRFIGLKTHEFLNIEKSLISITVGDSFYKGNNFHKLAEAIAQNRALQKLYERRKFYVSSPTIYGYKDGECAYSIKSAAVETDNPIPYFQTEY